MPDAPRLTGSEPTRPPESRPESAGTARVGPDSGRRLNWRVIALVCVIIGGAFAISADSWVKLAESAGFATHLKIRAWTMRLAYVLPVVVDAYTALATWLYLGARPSSALRRFAGRAAFASAGLSVLAQGAYHGLAAGGIVVAEFWPLVVLVGAIPPVLLASAIHLLATYLHDHRPVDEAPANHARPVARQPRRARPETASTPETQGETAVPTRPEPAEPTRLALVPAGSESADATPTTQVGDDELREAIRPYVAAAKQRGAEPVQREMVRIVRESTGAKVGQKRCVRVAESIAAAEDDSADDTEERSMGADMTGVSA